MAGVDAEQKDNLLAYVVPPLVYSDRLLQRTKKPSFPKIFEECTSTPSVDGIFADLGQIEPFKASGVQVEAIEQPTKYAPDR